MQPCLPKERDLARALHKQDYPTCQPSAPPQGSEDHKNLFCTAAIINQLASMKSVQQTILLGVFGRYFVKKKHMNMLSYLNGSCNVLFFIECVNVCMNAGVFEMYESLHIFDKYTYQGPLALTY
jgi:hypothetical protein